MEHLNSVISLKRQLKAKNENQVLKNFERKINSSFERKQILERFVTE